MSRVIAGIGSVLVVALLGGVAAAQETDPAGEAEMFARLNELREAAGVAAVVRDEGLDQAARVHSADMAWNNFLDHVSPRTGDPGARVSAAGLRVSHIAENVAMNRSAANAEQALEGSEFHRANMVDVRFTRVGLSVVRGQRGYYVTQVFARRSDEPMGAPGPAAGGAAGGAGAAGAAAAVGAGAAGAAAAGGAASPGGAAGGAAGALTAGGGAGAAGAGAAGATANAAGGATASGGAAAAGAAGAVGAGAAVAQGGAPQGAAPAGGVAQGALPPPAVSSPGAQPPGRRIAGYWVYQNGRWWYYPAAAGAQQPVAQQPQVQQPAAGWTYPTPGQRWQQNGTYTYPYQYNYQSPGYQYQPRRRVYYYGR